MTAWLSLQEVKHKVEKLNMATFRGMFTSIHSHKELQTKYEDSKGRRFKIDSEQTPDPFKP
jgi:hypothetical protein